MWILKSFCIIFPWNDDILKKPCFCDNVSWYIMGHSSIILRLSLSLMKANVAEF